MAVEPSGTDMLAWRSTAVGRAGLGLERCPRPKPGPGELLVAVQAAALNFSDLLMIDDKYQVRPGRPFIPGQEIAGIVVDAGVATSIRPGQLIASKVNWGGFSEYALVNANMAIALPSGTDPTRAAALPVSYTTAMIALTDGGRIKPGEVLLVHAAAGGLGLAAVEIGKQLGAYVVAAAGGAEKGAVAAAHGADLVLDYTQPGWVEAARALGGGGVDVALDPVGGDITLQTLRCMARDGRLLIAGFASGAIPNIPANRLLLKRISAVGVYWNHEADGPMIKRAEGRIIDLLRSGRITPQVDSQYDLRDLPRALDALGGRRSIGKIVLRVGAGGVAP